MDNPIKVKIDSTADLLLLRPLDLFVRQLVQQLPAFADHPSEVDGIELAFNEAYTNISRHAYRGFNTKGPISIEIIVYDDRLEIYLEDRGTGFDPENVKTPDLDVPKEGGLGVWFIKKFMDQAVYSVCEGKNVLLMMKRFPNS